MDSLPLAHTSWLKPFVAYFAERGVSLRPHCLAAEIAPELLDSGEGWITKRQLYGFLNEVARRESMPEVGFVVGERLTPDTLGAIGEAILKAGTLGEALQLFCRLIPRHVEGNHVWVEEGEAGDVWLFNETVDRIPGEGDIADHGGVMSLINLVRLGAGPDWRPRRATLQAGPTGAWQKVPSLRDCAFEFNQEATGVAFPGAMFLEPLSLTGTRDAREAKRGLLPEDASLVEKLRHLLHGIIGVGGVLPSVQLAAEITGTSVRTLHRRLRKEGITWQELLDETRFARARELLLTTDATVKELAFELGYSGPNNFIRAFQRIEGLAPGEFSARGEAEAKQELESERSPPGSS